MAFTTHGHHIEGSPMLGDPVNVARCGGTGICVECSKESLRWRAEHQSNSGGIGGPIWTEIARDILFKYLRREHQEDYPIPPTPADIYIVWFTKTLQHWKAILGTQLPDGRMYELIHNGDTNQTYIHVYARVRNVTFDETTLTYRQESP